MKGVLIILALIVIMVSGCSSKRAAYYPTNESDCDNNYHILLGNRSNYCIRLYDGWAGTLSGEMEFERDIVKCNSNETVVRNHNYTCWELREIINLQLPAEQKQIKTTKTCNYPQYNKVEYRLVDWKTIYLEECV